MATIVLGVVGNSFGPVGGFIGAAVGGIIDNYLIMPALFPTEPLQGPRLNDLQVQTAAEGTPVKWVLGPQNRVGGTAIWMLPLKEVQNTESAGGKGGGGQEVTNYLYYGTLAIGVCETRGLPGGKIRAIRKIWADTKVIYDDSGPTEKYKSIQIYLGDQTTPNSLIQADQGVDDTPHYNGLAYVVIEELALAEFGNRIPNFTFWVEQDSDVSLGEAVGYILQRGSYDPAEFDTSHLSQCFRGMIVSGPQIIAAVLNPLLLAYGVGCQDRSGVLTFFNRGSEYVVSVNPSDLAAHDEGSDTDRPFQIKDQDSFTQPFQCTVKFVSTDNDLQQGSQVYTRANYPNKNEMVIDFPITLKPETGKAIAVRSVWVAEAERKMVTLDLPPKYVMTLEGDRLEFSYAGVAYQVFVASITTGNNGRVHVEGFTMEPETYSYVAEADSPAYGGQDAYRPPATTLAAMDCTSLHPDLLDKIGVYYAICATDPTKTWNGGALYSSTDNLTYTRRDTLVYESAVGVCLDGLSPGPVEVMDTTNTMIVQMRNGTLSSCTYDELVNGTNRALVQTTEGDWEAIGFQTATLLGNNTYLLSNLLRGRRGTEHLVGDHPPGALFVLVQLNGIRFVERPSSQLGIDEWYKGPAAQGDVVNYPATLINLQGRSCKPFAPCSVEMTVDGSNNYIFTWTRRSKSFFRLFGPAGAPFTPDESPEGYIVEVLRSPGFDAAVDRTTVVNTPTWTYTAAQMTADGRTPGTSACTVKIYQRSNAVGRGTPFHGTFRP